MEAKNISKILSIVRKNKNITQKELCGVLSWDRSRLAKIETNCQNMYLRDFLKLCEGLEVCPLDVIRASKNLGEVPEYERLITKDEKKKLKKIAELQSKIDKLKGDRIERKIGSE